MSTSEMEQIHQLGAPFATVRGEFDPIFNIAAGESALASDDAELFVAIDADEYREHNLIATLELENNQLGVLAKATMFKSDPQLLGHFVQAVLEKTDHHEVVVNRSVTNLSDAALRKAGAIATATGDLVFSLAA